MSSSDYFRMRASHCRTMAEASNDREARRIHQELADRYARQAVEADAHAAEPNAGPATRPREGNAARDFLNASGSVLARR